jgi:hypothetical protein
MWMCPSKTYGETHGLHAMLLLKGIGMKNCKVLATSHIVFRMINLLHMFSHT